MDRGRGAGALMRTPMPSTMVDSRNGQNTQESRLTTLPGHKNPRESRLTRMLAAWTIGRAARRRFSQLQDLSDCAGIAVQLNGRFDVFQRRVGAFQPGTGENADGDAVSVDLSVPHQSVQERQRRG